MKALRRERVSCPRQSMSGSNKVRLKSQGAAQSIMKGEQDEEIYGHSTNYHLGS
jgi:hypothetical protein